MNDLYDKYNIPIRQSCIGFKQLMENYCTTDELENGRKMGNYHRKRHQEPSNNNSILSNDTAL